mgnify:CR=1 FL=1
MGDEERDEMMDDEEGGGAEEVAGSGETSKLVKLLLYIAGGVLILVLVFGISYLVSKYVQESQYAKDQEKVAAPPPPPLTTFELQDFSKTTADTEPHFVKMKISLGYDHTVELQTELVKRKDQIRHIVNLTLQGKKYEDLNSVSDQITLAEELKAHVNKVLISGKVKEVYFKEFVVN